MQFPIRLFPASTNIRFMEKKWLGFAVSLLLTLGSILLIATRGLNFGIDFTGGIVIEARFPEPPNLEELRQKLSHEQLGEIELQNFGTGNDVLVRMQQQPGGEAGQQQAVAKVKSVLGNAEYRRTDFVGPQVGGELIRAGIIAVLLSFLGIMSYIWARFEWQYGVGVLAAIMHDAIVTLGFFSLFRLDFNLTSIAAILTIVGYSVNDSVVIYGRIRDNMRKFKGRTMDEILNKSINETLSRTLLTASTTLLSLLALVLLGGEVIRSFTLSMLFGIVIGTYSSIYISAPVLIFLNLRSSRK